MAVAQIGDCALHYEECGEGPVLVLLHGLGGSSDDWRQQIPYFAKRYRVIVPDLRGFGSSGRGRHLPTVARLADDIRILLAQLGVERYRLVGHSMGGAVAQQLALEQADRIEQLVISNSLPSFRPRTWRHWREFMFRFLAMALLGPRRLGMLMSTRLYPSPQQTAQRARSIAQGARNSRLSYLCALLALGHWSVLERLARLPMPILVLGAEFDYFERSEVERFAEALPSAQIEFVAGAHHALPSECAAWFNARVERFFSEAAPVVMCRPARCLAV